MWYQAFDRDQWDGGISRLCYAVSQDGLRWEKPSHGLVEYDGSTQNNILLNEASKLGYVFIDLHGKPEQRYKMLTGIGTTRIRRPFTGNCIRKSSGNQSGKLRSRPALMLQINDMRSE